MTPSSLLMGSLENRGLRWSDLGIKTQIWFPRRAPHSKNDGEVFPKGDNLNDLAVIDGGEENENERSKWRGRRWRSHRVGEKRREKAAEGVVGTRARSL